MKHLNQTTAQSLLGLNRAKTIFLIPVAGIEDAGMDQPMGQALDLAEAKCIALAQKIEIDLPDFETVLFPKIPFCVDGAQSSFVLKSRGYVLKDWLIDTTRSLIKKDFIYFVCISGTLTPKTLTAIEEAGKAVRQKYAWRKLLRGVRMQMTVPVLISLESVGVPPAKMFSRKPKPPVGLDEVFPKLRAVLEGANPEAIFRSWYSIVPTNRTFFKAWLLLFGVILVLSGWVWLNFNMTGV